MAAHQLKWYRDTDATHLEDKHDTRSRREAVEQIIDNIDDLDPDDVEYRPPGRLLSADPGPVYQVCELVVENAPAYYLIYEYVTDDDENEAEPSAEEVLEETEGS